jgi:hypothetical protein
MLERFVYSHTVCSSFMFVTNYMSVVTSLTWPELCKSCNFA